MKIKHKKKRFDNTPGYVSLKSLLESGYSQGKISKLLQVNASTLSNWVTKKSAIGVSQSRMLFLLSKYGEKNFTILFPNKVKFIGRDLHKVRHTHLLSQNGFSSLTGLSQGVISRYETTHLDKTLPKNIDLIIKYIISHGIDDFIKYNS